MNEQSFNDMECEKRSGCSDGVKWQLIDWQKAEEYVNRLQLRIVMLMVK